ncbi:precorrin-6A synthase (deacetylating) [Variovorax sp. J22P271]|uniref:precorrin-6A synthase (deacetylating) n=1 Tax=Variovorax davisae TaxID=3053515 RepID=UPI002577B45C|nr:precorrin-6A synthase (deacetylating) [Variovorax sp. J22P271]MDM0035118.1 precorrin-6A synthase (deacetylating) [Variovorax sp. J22P271]
MDAIPTIELMLIGIGTGHPEHLTLQAIGALKRADLVLIPRKGADKADLAELRREVCATHLDGQARLVEFDLPVRDSAASRYLDGVQAWHAAIAAVWAERIATGLPQGGRVALLVWGDPSLYDSSLRIAERLQSAGMALRVEVIPGLSSVQLLTAAHAIPLNTLGASVLITTGRQLRAGGWPAGLDTVVVLLDGACAFQVLPPEGIEIYWAAYLGMPHQLLLAGPLASTGPRIAALRAGAREAHGWIMDSYLLRRSARSPAGAG